MDLTWGLWLVLGFVLGAAFLVFARRLGAQGERRLLAGAGAGVAPEWYVAACISFDLLVAGYVVARFRRTPVAPHTA